MGRQTNWTAADRRKLVKWYPDKPTKWIAEKLGKTLTTTYQQAYKLGLKKSENYMRQELLRQQQQLRVVGVKGRFKKGHVPANKGMKKDPHVIAAIRPFMFKKGQVPHNVKYDGHERVNVEGYIEIRVAIRKYVLKHRHVWEQAHGKVPEGYIVTFKDGNRLNCDIDNLTLITRREIMARNSIHRLPENLKQTIRTLTSLKRQINAKEQN